MNQKAEKIILLAAFAIFVATSLFIAIRLPRGRGNDEDSHATYVRYVADFGRLPAPLKIDFGVNREPHQPPLYYLGGAVWLKAARLLGLSQDAVRLYSLEIGAVWFWLVWLIARKILPAGLRIMPNLILASLPMAAQLSGTVNDDILSITLSTALIFCAIKIWQSPDTHKVWYILAALAGVGAVLSKLFAVPVVLVIGAALTWRAVQRRQPLAWLLGIALAAVPLAWWLNFNFQQTGQLIPEINLGRLPELQPFIDPWNWGKLASFLAVLWQTFIGRLGSWDVQLPAWFYYAQIVFWSTTLVGLAINLTKRRQITHQTLGKNNFQLAILAFLAFVACFIPLAILNKDYFQPQARYIYPGLVGMLMVASLGWLNWTRLHRWLMPSILLVLDLAALFATSQAL